MARSVRGASAAAAGRGVRFPSAPSDYRFLLPTLPSGDSMEECVFLHGDLKKGPYRLENFRAPLEEVGLIKAITGIGAFQMSHIWLMKMRSKDDKDELLQTGGLRVKGGFCAIIDPIQHDVTVKIHWVDFAVSNESIRQALTTPWDPTPRFRQLEKRQPTRQQQDGKDSTKESEELAATGGQQDIQESMEEDMGTSGEIATPEASTKSPEATSGRGKRYRVKSTERNLKRPERLWHRVTGAKSKKYALETRSASSSPVRGQDRDA
ncbi:hypothetical protein HPB51_026685 [Rhipicephalus microplus]|uniref:Uncharacterized protein n=1 Tax=Rhipicephalus microplus TaxID=6941 RepID=A0A9J6D2E5_RHIMP|nr:hypothetical protein HPB51_026685 [Rhipicephalus microplus]